MSDALITLDHISYRIRERDILQDISLDIANQQILTIVGPNGAGKSTLLKLILGLIKPSRGRITRAADLTISVVPQHFTIPDDLPMTVARFLRDTSSIDQHTWLEQLGIEKLLSSPLQQLSGGERQRLLLARAILRDPDLIVLDEPAAGIDPASLGQFYHLIREYQQQSHCAIAMVSHDLHLVMAASDQVICLNQHICCQGLPQELATHPDFLRATGQPLHMADIGVYTHHHNHSHL